MGASSFCEFHRSNGRTRKETFRAAVEDSQEENGTGGYSGTIAEKSQLVSCGSVKTLQEGYALAEKLDEDDDSRIRDKWGPAGAIEVEEPHGWVFFGRASD